MTERKPKWIDRPAELKDMAARLKEHAAIGVDTEFIREKTFFPKIALIQVATDRDAWLVDPVALQGSQLDPLREVFADPGILKIMHAAFADQECLYWAFGEMAEPVFDTAVGAALLGFGDNVGLGKLTKQVLGITLPKGRARAKWLARPLSLELQRYAESDVAHLVEIGQRLRGRLEELGRWEWALEESRVARESFDSPPDDIAERISRSGSLDPAGCAVLLELVRWREGRAREADMPRNWIADNETLRSLAKARPASMRELETFRGLNAREVRTQGEAILAAIRKGKSLGRPDWQGGERGPIPTEAQSRATDLLKAYTNYLATEHAIAPRFLLTGGKFFQLLQLAEQPEKWVEKGVLSERACRLVGRELEDFLHGRRGLAIESGQVRVIQMG